MSTDSAILDVTQEIFTINLLHIVGISILYYDYSITSGNEVEYVWRRSKTKSAYLFFLNRYFAFFSNIADSVLLFVESERCSMFSLLREVILVCNQAIVAVLLSLRVYALYDRSSRVAWFIAGSAMILIGISGWGLSGQERVVTQQVSGCHYPLSHFSAIHQATPWEALLAYDLILFSLTMTKTWRDRNEYAIGQTPVSLRYIVIRDGAIYFMQVFLSPSYLERSLRSIDPSVLSIIGAAYLTNILTFYFCAPILRGALSTFASAMSSTMMSRLMLNLHENANSGIYYTSREVQSRFQVASFSNM